MQGQLDRFELENIEFEKIDKIMYLIQDFFIIKIAIKFSLK